MRVNSLQNKCLIDLLQLYEQIQINAILVRKINLNESIKILESISNNNRYNV